MCQCQPQKQGGDNRSNSFTLQAVLRAECLKFPIKLGTKGKFVMGITGWSLYLDDCGLWRHTQHLERFSPVVIVWEWFTGILSPICQK